MILNQKTDLEDIASIHVERIDERLAVLIPRALPGQTSLDAAIRDSVLSPGKRLRPLMSALTAQDLGGDLETAIDAGCAVEMVHAASLILDDLPSMDDAVMRRGRPAIHVSHGEDVAVLSSIAILSGACRMLASIDRLGAEHRLAAICALTDAVGVAGLVGGQFADLSGGRGQRPVTEIAAANSLKTGSLFTAAVEIGAIVAGSSDRTRAAMRRFAAELGHAFQLLDDLLDDGSSPVPIGKDVGQDAGKSTIVSLIGRSSVEHRIEKHVQAAHRCLTEVFGPASRLHRLTDVIFKKALRDRVEDDVFDGTREPEVGFR